jgi:hypothetical protein
MIYMTVIQLVIVGTKLEILQILSVQLQLKRVTPFTRFEVLTMIYFTVIQLVSVGTKLVVLFGHLYYKNMALK